VREVPPAGWTCSFPAGCQYQEIFEPEAPLIGNDFGNWTTASKAGTKFNDLNGNGVRDAGEPGMGGWTIFVDYNDNNTLDIGEPSAVTAADGSYTIIGIDPGEWFVREVQQAGWTCSFPAGCEYLELFASGDQLVGNDFGNWTTATKAGTKFNDLNMNGVRDAGEPGMGGWTIFVDYNDNFTPDVGEPSAVTAADGSYTITGIDPGIWYVREVQQAGWVCTYPVPCQHQETFLSSDQLTGNDFGNWELTSGKTGTKFEDLDADGQPREAGEPGLAGWTIYVDYNNSNTLDAGEPFGVTAADGSYAITNVNVGTCRAPSSTTRT
jgi:hypothetical protein